MHRKQAKVLLDEKAELEIALREKDAQVEKVKVMITEQEKFEEQRAAVRAAIAEQRNSEEVRSYVSLCFRLFMFCLCDVCVCVNCFVTIAEQRNSEEVRNYVFLCFGLFMFYLCDVCVCKLFCHHR